MACGSGSPVATAATPSPVPSSAPTAPADATVGPAGGTVTALGGAVRLVIPAGALATPTAFSIRVLAAPPLDPHVASHSEIEISPSGAGFAAPATLVLRYDPALGPSGVAESELRLHSLSGGAWQAVAGGSIDAAAHEVTATVTSTGAFAARWPGPQAPCAAAEDRQFDFWVGRWGFTAPNAFPGTNDVTLEAGECLVEEHFQDSAGVRGRSVSLFSRQDGRWHQTYVDTVGGRLVLVGAFEGGRMVLYQNATDRFVWHTLDPRTVRYAGERTSDGGATWTVSFDARYARQ
jgi:hypothetical protein